MTWPSVQWKVGAGAWCWASTTQLLAGDLNGDGIADLNAIYDDGGANWRLLTFMGPALDTPVQTGNNSGPSYATALKAAIGDFNGDGRDDIGHFYNSGTDRATLWILYSTGTAYTGENMRWDAMTAGGLDWNRLTPL